MRYLNLFRLIKVIPRWTVLQLDLLLCSLALSLAYLLRFNFEWEQINFSEFWISLLVVVIVKAIFFLVTQSFAGIIRYTSIEDAKRIFLALTYSMLVVGAIDFAYRSSNIYGQYLIPVSILLIDYFFSMLFMGAFRILVKIIYFEWKNQQSEKINVIIYGAGEAGVITKKTISQDKDTHLHVVGFLDDDPSKARNTIDGVPILPNTPENLHKIVKNKQAEILIIAIQDITPERKKRIIDQCLALNVQVRNIPPVHKWINGELSLKQIKDVNIEDVLGRKPIQLDKTRIKKDIEGKVVLVTGAAGSIGSELARQIAAFQPEKLLLVDQSESALYDLELEVKELALSSRINFRTILCDITNAERMGKIFRKYQPEIVFHAAAYKHVPVMEDNPSEAIINNVLGTKIVADLSARYHTEKFVMISTDKAVNPTSVMGASKRIAEIYIQSLNEELESRQPNEVLQHTKFITTRFGNVLGSNGSVIPRFQKQINIGGPITVTHPEITRYFMTIPEACQLVLEAGSMGNGGEIFLFDMGESIKIVDLAKKMIRLSGLTLGKDIQLVFTGLRPGEKLYEELLSNEENTVPTHHPQIMIAKVREYDFNLIQEHLGEMNHLLSIQDNDSIIMKMKKIVPEYISNNSTYERLDQIREV
ncbi:nucleoside-diphosphate sugar epimerase/dehydratase [Cytophagaceae bacterium DM2B3-1]|uniref:Nucleoside-diphosphate sugar epimerase/dehydratase n=1 Tax=Xanthocytophaga flava TaxID=3048013 RepID=A0ABT7CQJ4_9BACT|nr:nucleoside-diphosphate sugar epimerase/dehydratase [Xanthocytophaga flavus]MDJ1468104.1 nucleoside-diphosphate sugar epimerase/dehydratase [Xanthocytophaga flavus]MDJ1496000.1 nucleoside-diphosphate sugar epimerase/dehydratase [Xanthocytophaga flavus]